MRYKENLRIKGDQVWSYSTHVATIKGDKLIVHGYWSMTTSKHINHVAAELGLTKVDGPRGEDHAESGGLKSVAMVAQLGNIIHAGDQKSANDWKARMLKAGLEGRGLIMPEDWSELPEDEKTRRLDGAIAEIASK